MTFAELQTSVNSYFAVHMDASYWAGLDDTAKANATSTALSDILAAVGLADVSEIADATPAAKAVAEQAVYLSRNYAEIATGKATTSEGLGDLSASYTLLSDASKWGISPRAQSFIKQAKALRGFRFARG